MKDRFVAGLLLCGALVAVGHGEAQAQAYPSKPVHLVVPYAAGGGVDNVARSVSHQLAARLKQPVIIDNRAGANGNIGADSVAKAAPDGYTLLVGATFLAFNRATTKDLAYDSLRDLVPIARVARAPFVLVVPVSLPAKNVAELVAYLKANADSASYGSVGAGSPGPLIFSRNTGTKAVQVLYKGGAAAMPDLMAGRLTYMLQTSSEVLPLVLGGKLRALAVTGTERLKALPNVPTMKEAGVANLELTGWWGLYAPAKTPPEIIERLSREMQAVLAVPEVVEALGKQSIEPAPMPAAEFGPFYRNEVQSYAAMVKEFNIVVE